MAQRSTSLGIILGVLIGISTAGFTASPGLLLAEHCPSDGTGDTEGPTGPCNYYGSITHYTIDDGHNPNFCVGDPLYCKEHYSLGASWDTGCIRSAELWFNGGLVDSYSFSASSTGATGGWNVVGACNTGGSGQIKFFEADPTTGPSAVMEYTFSCQDC